MNEFENKIVHADLTITWSLVLDPFYYTPHGKKKPRFQPFFPPYPTHVQLTPSTMFRFRSIFSDLVFELENDERFRSIQYSHKHRFDSILEITPHFTELKP